MSRFKQVIKWIISGLTAILLIILVMVVYGKCILTFTNNKYPSYFGYTIFEVASGSMEPTLYANDVILIKITRDNLKKDDIIAFNNENAIITHRIVFLDGDTLTVKGDNNNTIDMPIQRGQIIGKVVKVFPKLGIWKKVITEPKILIAIFVTLLLFDFALSYDGTNKKDKIEEKLDEAFNDNEEEKVVKKNDVVESDKLLEATRKIDISEINELLEKQDIVLSKRERKKIEKEVANDAPLEIPEEKKPEYTARLDLNEIQKKINKKIK